MQPLLEVPSNQPSASRLLGGPHPPKAFASLLSMVSVTTDCVCICMCTHTTHTHTSGVSVRLSTFSSYWHNRFLTREQRRLLTWVLWKAQPLGGCLRLWHMQPVLWTFPLLLPRETLQQSVPQPVLYVYTVLGLRYPENPRPERCLPSSSQIPEFLTAPAPHPPVHNQLTGKHSQDPSSDWPDNSSQMSDLLRFWFH